MKYYSIEEIQKIDKLVTEKYGIPSIILMENAGRTVADEVKNILKYYNEQVNKVCISVICGSGKNAGDGFVAARYLYNTYQNLILFHINNIDDYKGDVLINLNIIRKLGIKIYKINNLLNFKSKILKSDIIIDAIFGTGLNREVTGIYKDVINIINKSKKFIVSIDIPSGLNGDTGKPTGIAVKSNLTVTMGYLKKGFKNPEAKKFTGKIVVADIGYPFFL
jgi:NAD(P)H-hydrate epimerase